jgi:flagellar hook-associated protein 3 FlgL
MRITQNMMSRAVVVNLNRQAGQMLERQNIIATQKRLQKPSDDPAGLKRVLDYRKTLDSITQYQENIDDAQHWIEVNDLNLEFGENVVDQVKGLAETYGNTGSSPQERQMAADELKQLYDQLMETANAKQGDNYMYGGYQTGTAPFTRDDDYNATYHGDDGSVRFMVDPDAEISMDADGRNIFQKAADGGVNVFDILKDMIDGLENPDVDAGCAQVQDRLNLLDDAQAQIRSKRVENGVKSYSLDLARNHWTNLEYQVQQAVGDIENADVSQAAVELKSLQVAYDSTIATAAELIQPGLVNYLK